MHEGIRRLHIGGKVRKDGWEVLNAVPGPLVDHVCNAVDLRQFPDASFDDVYASHVLEHFDYAKTLIPALREWCRVLKPGGRLFVSVPDLETLARMVVDKTSFDLAQRHEIMRFIFGGHIDEFDYHMVGLDEELLAHYLTLAGFTNVQRVAGFELFDDLSSAAVFSRPISVNVIAEKPLDAARADPTPADAGRCGPLSHLMPRHDREGNRIGDPTWVVTTGDGYRYSVPANTACLTTYILLEQEGWFEKECRFISKYATNGMTVIDIGANLGLYTLPLSGAVGPTGAVVAYEPGADNRHHLLQTLALNGARNVVVSSSALSEAEKVGCLKLGNSGEFNALVTANEAGQGFEQVDVTTLDAQKRLLQWSSVDFVKIDAEGQERQIVLGGSEFFRDFSPLVMFEITAGADRDDCVRLMFRLLGYRIFRLTGDGAFLVPVANDELAEPFELNLFAAKPDRAQSMLARGLLADGVETFLLSPAERERAIQCMLAKPFAQSLEMTCQDIDECSLAEPLLAYAAYLYLEGMPAGRRHDALVRAFDLLAAYCSETTSPAALATLVRVANDIGRRSLALEKIRIICTMTDVELDQPFFPAHARYDDMRVGDNTGQWYLAAALEQQEILVAYSSYFHRDTQRIGWLVEHVPPSAELLRRAVLTGVKQGRPADFLLQCLDRLADLSGANIDILRGTIAVSLHEPARQN